MIRRRTINDLGMKRAPMSFVLFLLVALTVAGCGKKEGVVSTSQKIDHVMAVENIWQDTTRVFAGEEYVAEQWVWDGRKVIRIDYRGDYQYSENFFYDGRKMTSTTVPAYNLRSVFHYDGRELEKIDIFKKDKLSATMAFVHDDNGVSEIVCTTFEVDSSMMWPMWVPKPLKMIMGEIMAKNIGSKTLKEVHYRLNWDEKHKNVVKIDVNGSSINPYSIELSYDNKRNPYDQLFASHEMNEHIFGFKMLSENNVLSIKMPYENHGYLDFNYSYTYEGDYPSTCKLSYSYVTLSSTFDSVMMKVEQKESFFYK